MSPTETLTPQDLATANAHLARLVADLEDRLAAEKLRADREQTRADGLAAGTEALVAEHLRREENLNVALRKSRAERADLVQVGLKLQDALDAKHLELRAVGDEVIRLTADNLALTDAAKRPERRSLRRGVHRN